MAADPGPDRRAFLSGAALLALALGVPIAALELSPGDSPSSRQQAILRQACALVIPRSDTPGAGDVGVADFVVLALAHGLEDSRKPLTPDLAARYTADVRSDLSLLHLGWLEAELDRRAGGDFLRRRPAQRHALLAALDRAAFADAAPVHPWRTIKALILLGYYTSEAGGAVELRYVPVPGRWDPDLPQTPDTRAISNDWSAVDFG